MSCPLVARFRRVGKCQRQAEGDDAWSDSAASMEDALRDMVSHSSASMIPRQLHPGTTPMRADPSVVELGNGVLPMASPFETTVHPVTRSLPKWSLSWCKIFTAFIATRQKQADIRVAMYLRDLPESEDSIYRLMSQPRFATASRGQPGQSFVRDLTAGARRSPPRGLIAKVTGGSLAPG